MELIRYESNAAAYLARQLESEEFTLIDVGCAGGIDGGWRAFGDRLRAYGFDPSLQEVDRLNEAEANPKISYIAAFVGARPDGQPALFPANANNPYHRFSCAWTVQNRDRAKAAAHEATSHEDLIAQNMWDRLTLADVNQQTYLPTLFEERGMSKVDFVKLDVDGNDFEILRSLEPELASRQVLGVMLEVNFYGSDDPDENTFHNMDRFMRKAGYELYGLTVRTYSSAALPGTYLYTYPLAAQTSTGRPFQGDALYIRDLGAAAAAAESYSDDQLIKLVGVLALMNLPDYGAEVLEVYRERLKDRIDYTIALDLLAQEMQAHDMDINDDRIFSHAEYIERFQSDDITFYNAFGRRYDRNRRLGVMERDHEALKVQFDQVKAEAQDMASLREALDAAQARTMELERALKDALSQPVISTPPADLRRRWGLRRFLR